ncbi:hypothetical protein CKM354_000479300 [Cercospora kikuchii]|uniref:Uncharacterized protein n=1 Tax=Cercospora kikuchii TaxID=84275 RepID=A0A9P3FGH7_9PEZI|nr:uncharacterized protein CKM354_000479300 [Cercospora kikuchii]GIZ41490.1 hypothetical protein CKM354_000479300 [Cercospora kikuchii]
MSLPDSNPDLQPRKQQSSNAGNPFVCNICRKTYGRIDHLARHFRSHTNEKPFKCTECGKTFARADLLKRHATLHIATEESGKKRKIRASQACSACATIKVKCDQVKPCKRCRAKGLECRVDAGDATASRAVDRVSPVTRWTSSPGQSQATPPPAYSSAPAQPTYRDPTTAPTFEGDRAAPRPSIPGPNLSLDANQDHSLIDFLSSVVQPGDPMHLPTHPQSQQNWAQDYHSRDLMDFGQDLNINFGDLDAVLKGEWGGWLDPSLVPQPFDRPSEPSQMSEVSTPSIEDSINLSVAAYSRSAWRWIPNHEKGNQDHILASVLMDSRGPDGKLPKPKQIALIAPLESQERDRIVALLLAESDKVNYQKIVALFPSTRVLDVFLNDFLLVMEHSIDSWIHLPTFKPSESIPECLTLMIASGAILGRSSHAQRFGYALYEKARVALHEMFEADSNNTRKLAALQTYALALGIGTWSGDKRIMELAEGSALPLITMLRRAGRFRRSRRPTEHPLPTDTPEQLGRKWRDWVEAESFKRLAYHLFLHSVQLSVAFQTPPLLAYSEVTLELPAPTALWRAQNPEEWRDQYYARRFGAVHIPSFVSSMCDASTLGSVKSQIDLELSLYLVLMSHFCLAWEYTQISSANKAQSREIPWAGTNLAASKSHEITRLMDSFYVAIESWEVFVPKEVHMVSQLLRINLCVAFEDLQLLAGKEGEDEARRVMPALKQWFQSPACRQAVWHAGQVLRAARRPAGLSPNASSVGAPDTPWLRDFNAVVLYHAGLTFWVYGVLAKAVALEQRHGAYSARTGQQGQVHADCGPPIDYEGQLVHLDGNDEELTAVERHQFINLNKGRAVISAHSTFPRGSTAKVNASQRSPMLNAVDRNPETAAVLRQREVVPLDEPKRAMDAIIEALTPASSPPDSRGSQAPPRPQRPAMVENLIQLLRDLGEAASAV